MHLTGIPFRYWCTPVNWPGKYDQFPSRLFEHLFFLISDFYTKVCLLQQNRIVKTKKTEVIKKSANPNFNESFTFKLPVSGLDTASVTISAMQHFSGHKGR